MPEIKLSRGEWTFCESTPLGKPGGFGAVFKGCGSGGEPVAIKRLNLTAPEVAYRELHVAEELLKRDLVHILPFLDEGKDENSGQYFTVMPVAEKDLQDVIDARGVIPQDEAVGILLNVVDGLLEAHDLVHRDLKPKNVLLHDGKWKIADFGLARFLEESTSSNTVMEGMTVPYAAPEQWNLEHASHATDVYALGCIAYALLTGKPPFHGPSRADYKSQHLQTTPPVLQNVAASLRSLASMMLLKQQESRPELGRVRELLQKIAEAAESENTAAYMTELAKAGAVDAERAAAEEAATRQKTTVLNTRRQISEEGFRILKDIFNEMIQRIRDTVSTASIQVDRNFGGRVTFGMAEMEWGTLHKGQLIPENAFKESRWDVYAGTFIRVEQKNSRCVVGYGSNLWYMRRNAQIGCRWQEVSYMAFTLCGNRRLYEPFDLQEINDADLAARNGMDVYQIAYGPKPVDGEDMESFLGRWLERFADANKGEMQRPRKLPLD